jgi:hypothetical protein
VFATAGGLSCQQASGDGQVVEPTVQYRAQPVVVVLPVPPVPGVVKAMQP